MANFGEYFEVPVTIPEDGESFKEGERRRALGEKFEPIESEPTPIPNIEVRIPEDSDAFKDWERDYQSE